MKRFIRLSASIIVCVLATNLGYWIYHNYSKDKVEVEMDHNGVASVPSDTEAYNTRKTTLDDTQVQIQILGPDRTTLEDSINHAKNFGFIPADLSPDNYRRPASKTDIINAVKSFEKLGITVPNIQEYLDTNILTKSVDIPIQHLIPIQLQILNSYYTDAKSKFFEPSEFRNLFDDRNYTTPDVIDDKTVEAMSFLRGSYFDALLINDDDVFINTNTLTYEALAVAFTRLSDLRVRQLSELYTPEFCTKCGKPIQDFYDNVEENKLYEKDPKEINLVPLNDYEIIYAEEVEEVAEHNTDTVSETQDEEITEESSAEDTNINETDTDK